MRSVVAVVETRPETVVTDYRRLLELAQLQVADADHSVLLIGRSHRRSPAQPPDSPPWQLDGVLNWLAVGGVDRSRVEVACAGARPGLLQTARNPEGWCEVLSGHGVASGAALSQTRVRVHPRQPLPALAAALPDGYLVPSALLGRQLLLLPTPALRYGWPVAGAVAMLQDLIIGPLPKLGKVPVSEVTAELVALVQETAGPVTAVMDAVVWDTADLDDPADAVLRNVLLASADPVALDAVATRLTGADPRQQPWLQLCRRRGLGAVAPEQIHLVGRTDLLELDFGLNKAPFSSHLRRKIRPVTALGRPGESRRGGRPKPQEHGGWDRLLADYVSGAVLNRPNRAEID